MNAGCLIKEKSLKRIVHACLTASSIEHFFIEEDIIFESSIGTLQCDFFLIEEKALSFSIHKFKRIINTLYHMESDILVVYENIMPVKSDQAFHFIVGTDEDHIKKGIQHYLDLVNNKVSNRAYLKHRIRSKKMVLFVDARPPIHTHIKMLMDNSPYQVMHAQDGIEALEKMKLMMPSVVILSLELPDMSGYQLCKEIRMYYREYAIPIIIMTNDANKNTLQQAYAMGADDYLVEPLIGEKVLNKIGQYYVKERYNEKVLIVEDSLMIQNVLKIGLVRRGYNVSVASNGLEGYEMATQEKPDVIITDINMPIMDGYEMIQKVRETAPIAHTKVMIMSTLNSRYNKKQGEALGVEYYFVKPFKVDVVINQVEHMIVEKYRDMALENEYMITTINSLIKALEARDHITQGHTERVTQWTQKISEALQLPQSTVNEFVLAAKLHDIGKIGIRDRILLKPGPLTDEEYNIIKNHPEKGRDILSPIRSLEAIIPIIYHHHERIDGKGYPEGLRGSDIPLGAKIIAIADAFDAIVSDRPYRKGKSIEEAKAIISANAGTQFDESIVSIFLKIL